MMLSPILITLLIAILTTILIMILIHLPDRSDSGGVGRDLRAAPRVLGKELSII
jgi:hypothetical protein